MKMPDNIKIGAYLDSELPMEQFAEMEAMLSDELRAGLQKEGVFEGRLADRLMGPKCPDTLWKQVKHHLRPEENPSQSRISYFPKKIRFWLPLAASVAILAGLYFASDDPVFIERVSSVSALRAEAQLQDPMEVFAENGFNLSVGSESPVSHDIEVLGGYTAQIKGESIAVVCVDCCGEPMRILVSRKGSRAAKAVRSIEVLQTVVWRGDVQLAVIAEHPSEEVLSLFKNV